MKSKSATTFAQRLARSKLLEPGRLAQARAAVGDDETALSEYLLSQGWLTRFQVRQLRAGAKHFHVDKYIVVDYLGRGGNSLVFKARHTLMPGRLVALKTLDCRNLHHSEEALIRFRREIEILGRLEHPNIVHALDVIRTRSQLYLVLEHIDGCNLAMLVKERGPLPVEEAVSYTIQAARGLAYAHENGIVHRDLKPANLLLANDGVVKITDLGLARLFEPDEAVELTLKGCCLGTPEFMAPEQAEDASEADARSDIYSLGATLFHLLTAELPVEGSSQYQRLQRLLTGTPRALAEAMPSASPALARIVDVMRSRDPAARPSTAAEVIPLLEPFAGAKKNPEPPRWSGRRRAAMIASILQGEIDLPEAAARHGIPVAVLELWRQRFLEGAEQALDPATPQDRPFADHVRELLATVAKQAVKIEKLKAKLGSLNGK
jgi:eukaryotic-like serine/threonine-protein kinase